MYNQENGKPLLKFSKITLSPVFWAVVCCFKFLGLMCGVDVLFFLYLKFLFNRFNLLVSRCLARLTPVSVEHSDLLFYCCLVFFLYFPILRGALLNIYSPFVAAVVNTL